MWVAAGRYAVLGAACFALLAGGAFAQTVQQRTVVVRTTSCAGGVNGWPAPRSGRTIFTVRNPTKRDFFLVQVVSANSATPDTRYGLLYGKVYGEIGILAPRTTVAMDAVLPPGTYFFRCVDHTGAMSVSSVQSVRGKAVAGARPYAPLFNSQLPLAMLRYRIAVAPILKQLGADTNWLVAAVRAGNMRAARKLWLPAHLDYARLGVAYGTFGALDAQINGRPTGLARGVRDPQFRGFLRLEYGLWHGQSRATLAPIASALGQTVHTLLARASSPRTLWVDSDLPLRAHEILENTLQFELTGETDEGAVTPLQP